MRSTLTHCSGSAFQQATDGNFKIIGLLYCFLVNNNHKTSGHFGRYVLNYCCLWQLLQFQTNHGKIFFLEVGGHSSVSNGQTSCFPLLVCPETLETMFSASLGEAALPVKDRLSKTAVLVCNRRLALGWGG